MTVSTRAQVITRRTYNRPLNAEGTEFETWEETAERVIKHQRFLWERAKTANILRDMPLHDISEDMEITGLQQASRKQVDCLNGTIMVLSVWDSIHLLCL